MPKVPATSALPKAIRLELDQQLQANGFGDCRGLAEWLTEKGYEISKSQVGRYSKALKERMVAAENSALRARAIAEQFPESEPIMGRALVGLVQANILEHLMEGGFSADGLTSTELVRAIKDINAADLAHQKWQMEIQARIDAKLAELSIAAPENGLDENTIKRIREEIYGIVL
jgi:hypothetical protein